MRKPRLFCILLGLCIYLPILAAQRERPPAPAAPNGPAGSIEGTVVQSDNGNPLAGATVELHTIGPSFATETPYSTQSGADGKFVFGSVRPDDYFLVGAMYNRGFVVAQYGQTISGKQAVKFTLAPGQQMKNIQLTMVPTGTITGRVLDREGDPIGRAYVWVLKVVIIDGAKVGRIVQKVSSNDRGEYRFYWLPPGTYMVLTFPNNPDWDSLELVALPGLGNIYRDNLAPVSIRRTLENGETVESVQVPVYYPGVVDVHTAKSVELPPGGVVAGVDMNASVGLMPAFHVRGTVIDAGTGQPSPNARITIKPRDPAMVTMTAMGLTDAKGNFDIESIATGQYFLTAGLTVPAPAGTRIQPGRSAFFDDSTAAPGFVPLEVAGKSLNDVRVTARPSINITGRLSLSGRPLDPNAPELSRLSLVCKQAPDTGPQFGSGPTRGKITNGTLSLTIVPGYYRCGVEGLASNMYVRSMTLGSTDLLAEPLSLSAQTPDRLDVIVATDAGSVEGRAPAGATLVLIPDAPRRQRFDLYKVVNPDASGNFRIQGVEPGNYKLFAWGSVEPNIWQDSEFLQLVESRGRPVQVMANAKTATDAALISSGTGQ